MPRKKRPPFLTVDEQIMEDIEVQDLVLEKGYGALMIWLLILIKFKQYEKFDYMVPSDRIDKFCSGFYEASREEVKSVLVYAAGVGWIKSIKNEDGEEFFFNERRRNDLLNQKVTKLNRVEGAEKTNQMRGIGRYDNRTDNRDDNRTDDCDE